MQWHIMPDKIGMFKRGGNVVMVKMVLRMLWLMSASVLSPFVCRGFVIGLINFRKLFSLG